MSEQEIALVGIPLLVPLVLQTKPKRLFWCVWFSGRAGLLPPSSVLFPESMLSFLKGSITGEGENQDELANFEGCFPSKYLACIKGHRWRGWQTAASLMLPSWCPGEGHACSQQYFLLHVWPRWVCLTSRIEGLGHSKEELGLRGGAGRVFQAGD